MEQVQNALNVLTAGLITGIGGLLLAVIYAVKIYIPKRMELHLQAQKHELESKAQQRKIQYERQIQELENKAATAESLREIAENQTNLTKAVIEMAQSESRRTDVLHSNTLALTGNTQSVEHLTGVINDLATKVDDTHANSSATRKSAEEAKATIVETAEEIAKKVDDLIRLLTPGELDITPDSGDNSGSAAA